jgi:hypothetical protein
MGFALIMVHLVAEINVPMVSVLLLLHELPHHYGYKSPVPCLHFVLHFGSECKCIQGRFIYLAQMGNRLRR